MNKEFKNLSIDCLTEEQRKHHEKSYQIFLKSYIPSPIISSTHTKKTP